MCFTFGDDLSLIGYNVVTVSVLYIKVCGDGISIVNMRGTSSCSSGAVETGIMQS